MAKLIINPTSSSRREIQLPRTILSIGRDPSNDLVLPDAMVSRRHAVIEYRGSQFYLRDCSSSNGSLVNGDRVSERSLRDGDLVAIGTARLLFREEIEIEDAGAKVVQHPSAPRLQCPSCGADYRKGDMFCRQCGAQLAQATPKVVCTSCGTAVPLPAKFCNACGGTLKKDLEATKPRAAEDPQPASQAAEPPTAVPSSGPADAVGHVVDPADVAHDHTPPPSSALAEAQRPNRSSAAVEPALPPERAPENEPRVAALAEIAIRPLLTPVQPSRPAPVVARRPQAPLGRRLLAGLLDSAIVSVGAALLLSPAAFYFWQPDETREVAFAPILMSVLLVLLVAVLAATYHVYFWGVRGATPGKRVLGLAVESERGDLPIGVPKAFLRLVGYALSGILLGIGFLMAAFGGASLHDRIAGTRVVRREGL